MSAQKEKLIGLPVYVDEREVSRIVGRAIQTLRNDRMNGQGIPYSKVGRSVRYRLEDVVAFMERCKIQTEAA